MSDLRSKVMDEISAVWDREQRIDDAADAVIALVLAEHESALTARLAELEAALRPFDAEHSAWDCNLPDDHRPMICATDEIPAQAEFTLGDLRRAAALLAKEPDIEQPAHYQRGLPEFNDSKVQAVYQILCAEESPPNGEHWEGFKARRIVAALSKDDQREYDPTSSDCVQEDMSHSMLEDERVQFEKRLLKTFRPDELNRDAEGIYIDKRVDCMWCGLLIHLVEKRKQS